MKTLNRRKFLNQSCPILVSTLIAGALLKSCSPDELNNTPVIEGGYTVSGNTLTIDLTHPDFSALNTNGWINFSAQKVLILKKSSTEYQAFSNRCPHEGVRNRWTYSESSKSFVCKEHNNTYKTDCSTRGAGGVLNCYPILLNNQKIKITLG